MVTNCNVGVIFIASAMLLLGCQTQVTTLSSERALGDERTVFEALEKLKDVIELGMEVERCNDAELLSRMGNITWALSLSGGYDFRGNFELWELWRRWLANQDLHVITECLDSQNAVAVTLGVDIAVDSGGREGVRLVLCRYEEALRRGPEDIAVAYRWALAQWLQHHRPLSDTGGPGGFERVVRPTPVFARRLLDQIRAHDEALRGVREVLARQAPNRDNTEKAN